MEVRADVDPDLKPVEVTVADTNAADWIGLPIPHLNMELPARRMSRF